MSVEHFKVVFSGQVLDGFDRANVRQRFSERFRAPEKLVDRVFGGGAVVIKKDLGHQTAMRLAELLNKLGMQSRIKVMPPVIAIDYLSLEAGEGDEGRRSDRYGAEIAASKESARSICPKCGSQQVLSDECQSCGVTASKYIEIQAQVLAQDQDASSSEQQLRAERIDALTMPMGSTQAFQSAWKIMAPFILLLFISWRWYDRLVPEAFTEAELKGGYVEACVEYAGCMELLDSQWDQCFEQADYSRYQDATATQVLAEEEAFVERLDQCLVDEDGEAMFY